VKIARVQPVNSPDRELQLEKLLGSLCELALKEGADECAVIECGDLIFKETSSDIPHVPVEQRTLFWPVPRFSIDSMQDALRRYDKAVIFRLSLADDLDYAQEQIFKLAGLVESACFYGGYHLSIGLASGNCKDVFCKAEQSCQALRMGKPCLHPLKSRPSIEACGLDPEEIAAKAGWRDSDKDDFIVCMVFVG
jgi:predicted metal-binding protein